MIGFLLALLVPFGGLAAGAALIVFVSHEELFEDPDRNPFLDAGLTFVGTLVALHLFFAMVI